MAIPTPRLSIYRDRSSGDYRVQPSGLDPLTGAQPECWEATIVETTAVRDTLAAVVLQQLPRSMEPLEERRLVRQSSSERQRWTENFDSVFVEMPSEHTLRIVAFRRGAGGYIAMPSDVTISVAKVRKSLRVLSEALERAFRQAGAV